MRPASVVSMSGGKDSTAMLLMMLERGMRVDHVVYFDAGEWEFPQMHEHISQLENYVGFSFVRLTPRIPFVEQATSKPMYWRHDKDKIRFHGRGWPSPMRRWCTRDKAETIDRRVRDNVGNDAVSCIGYADDEQRRLNAKNMKKKAGRTRFPLIEFCVSEADARTYCRERGFDWGGLYDVFHRASCFCCPLQSLRALRNLRRYFPNLWRKRLEWETAMGRPDRLKRFHHEKTLHDLEQRFQEEDSRPSQYSIFDIFKEAAA